MPLIAVIDGDAGQRARLRSALRTDFTVVEASDGLGAIRVTLVDRPDAAIVNLETPGIASLELVRVLRAASNLPVIAMGEQHDPTTVAHVLEAGADDYVRPNLPDVELVARLRAAMRLFRRQPAEADDERTVRTGDLVISRDARAVTKGGRALRLTNTEYVLLDTLAAHIGGIVPRRFLISTIWGDPKLHDTQGLRAYVGYLRSKLEDDPSDPAYVLNEWGVGYRLARLPVAEAPAESRSLVRVASDGLSGGRRVPASIATG